MTRVARAVALGVVLAGSLLLVPTRPAVAAPCRTLAAAGRANHAGIVIEFGDLSTREFCVSFTEESISGFELLQRTGLALVYQDYGGGSVTICKIGGEGCDYPAKPCFCQCLDAGVKTCTFWGYYRIDSSSGAWRYANGGPGSVRVRDGDLEGWRWGQHQQGLGSPAPSTLAGVCERGEHVGPVASPAVRKTGGASTPRSTAAGSPSPFATFATPAGVSPSPSGTGARAPVGVVESTPTTAVLGSEGSAAGARSSAPGAAGGVGLVAVLGGLGVWGARIARARRRERG